MGVALVLVMATSGCGRLFLAFLPTVDDASSGELRGDWRGPDGAQVLLEPDGRAEVQDLGGENWDFDEGWRLSGTGTWKLIKGDKGTIGGAPAVQVVITQVTDRTQRTSDDPDERTVSPQEPLSEYTWEFGMERTDEGLQPYYLAGDPDVATLYQLERVAEER
ncbi:hypothetical protein [Streptomyces sp. NPDC102409]|uniref:hypothetical protein n=1 Tax=Streptomyces sp. NPDC102409 TaxID=3366172 RepID=UPI003824E2D8